ncbi:MAG TPA: hypothetical protein PLH43_01730 [Acetivibrio sp.]|uniref:hypothetical protein n=1 Tax=Acetivibrio sp. TaxID=1872092 RepID=UPI002BDB22F4|nr:hypothetical protein [Acetivibrio sp.]HOM01534.1 hypothetical protein [Acetivibrio sp.]
MAEENNFEPLDTAEVFDDKESLRDAAKTASPCAISKPNCFTSFNEAAVILFFILVFLLLFYE